METFKKRQKEMKRLERQRDKAAKRQENKARKAAGLPSEPDQDTDATENAAPPDSIRAAPSPSRLRAASSIQ